MRSAWHARRQPTSRLGQWWRKSGPPVAGALTGLALIAIIWGAAWAWPPADSSGRSTGAPSAGESAMAISSSPVAEPKTPPEPAASTSAGPAPEGANPSGATASSTPPVPVLATVTYDVAPKGTVTVDLDQFAAEVAAVFADPRGWPAAGIAFERVASGGDFTVWLTQPEEVPSFSSICTSNLSCSIGPNIIINETRWLQGALPGAMEGVALADYRAMVVNHEVGHWLGHHFHSSCPGPGEIAPLMMQQSKGLDGCVFNQYPLPSELTAPDLFG